MEQKYLIEMMAQSTVVLLFFAGIFSYVVLRPLNISIKSLEKAIEKMNEDEIKREEKRQAMDLRLVKVEESAKSAHHRIDSVKHQIQYWEKERKE